MQTVKNNNSKKILIPLATLAVAGAVVVGSGATFSSETGNTISSVTSGSLEHTNSKDGAAIFDLTNMKPGDVLTGSLTLKNTGSLPADFSLVEESSANGFTADNLQLTITNTTTSEQVFTGTFGALADGAKTELGEFAAGASNTFQFVVALKETTGNDDQGKTASATYTWHSVQLDGEQSAQ